jgi:hypothetical protein
VLYRLLLPWADLTATDHPEGMRGSVSLYLGLLAASTQRCAEAERHLEHALDANRRMGLRPWVARTEDELARLLLERGADAALQTDNGKRAIDYAQTDEVRSLLRSAA